MSFADLPENAPDGSPVIRELWNGELVEMPSPAGEHGSLIMRLGSLLFTCGEMAGLGKVSGADAGIVLAPEPPVTLFGADVSFWTSEQCPPRMTPQGWFLTMPALVIEVRSKRDQGRHSLKRKIERYLKHGVQVVWEVDPAAQAVTIHRAGARPVRLGIEDELTAEGIIPSLRFPIRRLFADLMRPVEE